MAGAIKLTDTAQNCSHATDTGAVRCRSVTFVLQSCKNGTGWTNVGGTATPAGSDQQVQWNNNGTLAASSKLKFNSTSGLLTVTGDINYSGVLLDTSDRRAKDNIQPLPSGQLGKLMQLQPVSFVMKSDPQHRTELGLMRTIAERLLSRACADRHGRHEVNGLCRTSRPDDRGHAGAAGRDCSWAGLAFVFCVALLPTFLLWKNRKMR